MIQKFLCFGILIAGLAQGATNFYLNEEEMMFLMRRGINIPEFLENQKRHNAQPGEGGDVTKL